MVNVWVVEILKKNVNVKVIEKVELNWTSDIPVYLDRLCDKNTVLIGRNSNTPTKKFIIVSSDVYEILKWNEYDINDERYKKLKAILDEI